VFSQQEMGPAQRIVDYLNRGCGSVGKMGAFPKRSFRRAKVFPEGSDEPATSFRPSGRASRRGCGVSRRGGIQDDAPARNETHGLHEYLLAILRHCCPQLFEPRHGETQRRRSVRTCIMVRP
jgi:hypothetical protein